MITLTLTETERADRKLSSATVDAACRAIREDGFVVLDRVVDPAHVAAIRDAMLADALQKIKDSDKPLEHIAQHPPRDEHLLFEDVLANPFGIQVAEAMMGASITFGFYESNTNLPGSKGQQLHTDMHPRKAEDITDGPCNSMVLNIPLIDFTIENGATEVWPGTHLTPTEIGSRWVSDELQAERMKIRPKEQAVMNAGSMLLRDIRLWHRGVPNPSQTIRTMIAMIVGGGFDRAKDDLLTVPRMGVFPASTRAFFQGLRVATNPVFDDDPAEVRESLAKR